ncbi:MAG: DUF3726 domain-containing protein [Proteobacteria bacterium]|nr:DUF3726 domain-containing protein [Pseudomonadota bacterium]
MRPEPNDPTQSGPSLTGATEAIRLSRNEVASLCAKAARGAGMDWGLTEEAGFAIGWLHRHGVDGASALLAHLERVGAKSWHESFPTMAPGQWSPSGRGMLCPVALGATLSDFCDLPESALDAGLTVGPVSVPVILLPFLSEIAQRRRAGIEIIWNGGAAALTGSGALSGDLDRLAALPEAVLILKHGMRTIPPADRPPMPASSRVTLERLDQFAIKTTVPPSRRSRDDAGADGDND